MDPCLVSKEHGGKKNSTGFGCSMLLLMTAHIGYFLGCLCSLPVAFLSRCSTSLAPLTPCGLPCTFIFILIASCTSLSGSHFLASQVFVWNLGGNSMVPQHLDFACLKIRALYGWCQGLLQTQAVTRSFWTTVEAFSEYLMTEHSQINLGELIP